MAALSAISLVSGLVGTGISAYSAIEQGRAQSRLAEYNAQLAQRQAQAEEQAGLARADAIREQNKAVAAQQRAGYGASGVDVNTGSPLLVQAKQAGYMEMAAMDAARDAAIGSEGYRDEATLDRMQGSVSRSAGRTGALASILQGTASTANRIDTNLTGGKKWWGGA